MPSTRSLQFLPDLEPLRRVCQAIAALDAVLSPDPEFRYYTYQKHWGPDRQLASMRDGAGDDWHLVFSPAGAVLKGFVHDSTMAEPVMRGRSPWPGVLDGLPPALAKELEDPALSPMRATFCVWRLDRDEGWHRGHIQFPGGRDPDGSGHLMAVLNGDPITYARWAEQYYEIEIPFIEVRRIYMLRPMTEDMARSLNREARWDSLIEDLEKIGYPIAPGQVA